MKKFGGMFVTLFLMAIFWAIATPANAADLIASKDATIHYTTSGGDSMTSVTGDGDVIEPDPLPAGGISSSNAFYTVTSSTLQWDGTDANRAKPLTTDYKYTYGDENIVTYTMPWPFNLYGATFNQIVADTNGNIWFSGTTSTYSFNLSNNGRGPVISVWNNDLTSYYSGGVFIQHKTSPERVVIEWQAETYTDEGRRRPNNFEAVLYQTNNIRFDYKSFSSLSSSTNKDFGSGLSYNTASATNNLTGDKGNVFLLGNQSFLFTATGCSVQPVRKIGTSTVNYDLIQTAYNNAASGNEIRIKAVTCVENIIANLPITITLMGGYDDCFSTITGQSGIQGAMVVSSGTVIMDGLVIK